MKSWLYAMPLIALYPGLTRAAGLSGAELAIVSLQIFVMVTLVRIGIKWHYRREKKYRARALAVVGLAALGVYYPIQRTILVQREIRERNEQQYTLTARRGASLLPGPLHYLRAPMTPVEPCRRYDDDW